TVTAETGRDVFFPLVLAAEHTTSVQLATGIAVGFARNPFHLAQLANDLQIYSRGRFALGLGSQIRPHIEKRFSMPWPEKPAAAMRELVLATRAVWAHWHEGAPLDFRGDVYSVTLSNPFFNPGPSEYGAPKVYLAAVGPKMTEVAGEVCDGLLAHGFTTEKYLREVTIPAVEKGLARSGRARADFEVLYPCFVVTGTTEEELAAARDGVKRQIAFYGSTPAYRGVLECHGWGDLHGEFNRLSKEGKWAEMGALVDDEILDTFAVTGEPEELPGKILERFGDAVDRVSFYAPYQSDPQRWAAVLAGFKQ
ncbi:MAG TPA: TIGR03617 family F420-dependent LLM class oxidoreductase, partial [Acidimicrobiia bacterium]|nr:TIGR03617 family F420-dependent LLM class oxidoreductase [Acidimicrobiia bacterium]